MDEPRTNTPATITGGEVICAPPGRDTAIPGMAATDPVPPKPGQALPLTASRANNRRSLVAMKMRSAQGAAGGTVGFRQ